MMPRSHMQGQAWLGTLYGGLAHFWHCTVDATLHGLCALLPNLQQVGGCGKAHVKGHLRGCCADQVYQSIHVAI